MIHTQETIIIQKYLMWAGAQDIRVDCLKMSLNIVQQWRSVVSFLFFFQNKYFKYNCISQSTDWIINKSRERNLRREKRGMHEMYERDPW